MYAVLYAFNLLIQILALLMVAYFAAVWFLPKGTKARKAFDRFEYKYASRVFAPVRNYTRRIPFKLPVDLSPLVYLFALMILRSFVAWLMVRV
ncbi:MAG: YggT family protein [Oscillospiraceae bacterium]|jgi:uncharacterized protein YggT (Ycf19 family)|nr:YggT family protein [Oscillospiraceae bacterium]